MDYRGMMVGDWLLDKEGGLARRVAQVTSDVFGGCAPGVILKNGMDYQECEPIPLTAEVLEKNGFKKKAGDKYFPYPKYVWLGSEESGCIVSIAVYDKPVNGVNVLTQIHTNCKEHGGVNKVHNCDIGYVHELQHALRLCGLNELADNFII